MTHLLDTNSCIHHLRHGAASPVAAKLLSAAPTDIVLCSVVVAELSGFASLDFDEAAAEEYGVIRAQLDRAGTPIGLNDLMISAIARPRSLIVVTHNVAEVSRVSGLQVEDWQVP